MSSTTVIPPGRPCFPHIHLKHKLPQLLYADVNYELIATCTNEMDMWDSSLDTADWGNTLPVIQLQVLHPHLHALATVTPSPTIAVSASSTSTAGLISPSPSSTTTTTATAPIPSSSPPLPASLRLSNAAARLAPDCKPLLTRAGKTSLKFSLSPSPVILARTLSTIPTTQPLTHPFYLHVSIPGPLGSKILPAISGPHQLYPAPTAKGSSVKKDVVAEKQNYVMGEHGVHHAFFVPLDSTPPTKGGNGESKLPSVYSFPVSTNSSILPPAFIRFKEILGVNLGGRIWDCGLLLFEYLRDVILSKNPHYFHGRKILEVGSGTGVVGIWLWAYVLLKNRQAVTAAEKAGTKKPVIPQTTFLLTDQGEAMENLRENIQINLDLLSGGQSNLDSVELQSSELSWGNEHDHQHLAIQPTPDPFDLIIASDVVFNPIYFTPLLETLKYISGPQTTILMAYRPRASDKRQDEAFFKDGLKEYGWTCKKEGKYQDVFMLTLERVKTEATTTTTGSETPSLAALSLTPSPVASPDPVKDLTQEGVEPNPGPAELMNPSSTDDHSSSATSTSTSTSTAASSPVSSIPASTSSSESFDPFSQVLTLHMDTVIEATARAEGLAAGLKQVQADAYATGVKRGRGIGAEFGFYFGFLHGLQLLIAQYPNQLSHDPSKQLELTDRCQKLYHDFLSSPLYQSQFDPDQLQDSADFIKLRTNFKLLMIQLGMWEAFKAQTDTEQPGTSW